MTVHRNYSTYADGQERDRLVHSSERRHIDCLTADCTLRTDTGRVFTGTGVDDSIDENLYAPFISADVILSPRHTHLDGVLVGEKVDDLERVRDNADGQELLAVVAALHHQTAVLSGMALTR